MYFRLNENVQPVSKRKQLKSSMSAQETISCRGDTGKRMTRQVTFNKAPKNSKKCSRLLNAIHKNTIHEKRFKIWRSVVCKLFYFPIRLASGLCLRQHDSTTNVRDTTAAATTVRELGRHVVNELVLHTRRFTGRSQYEHNKIKKNTSTTASLNVVQFPFFCFTSKMTDLISV